jgi:dATP/dGTP diphosphohydrolase, N-terminal
MEDSPQKRLDAIADALSQEIPDMMDPETKRRLAAEIGNQVTQSQNQAAYEAMVEEVKEHGISTDPTQRELKATEQRDFSTGARRDHSDDRGRYDLISGIFLKRLAVHLEKGANKYAARNWEKGIPLRRSFESMIRHAYQWLNGDQDEDHLAAVACNIMFITHTEDLIRRGELPQTLLEQLPVTYLKSGFHTFAPEPMDQVFDFTKSTNVGPDLIVEITEGNVTHKEGSVVVDKGYVCPETLDYQRGQRDAKQGKYNQEPGNAHYNAGYNS